MYMFLRSQNKNQYILVLNLGFSWENLSILVVNLICIKRDDAYIYDKFATDDDDDSSSFFKDKKLNIW